MPAAKTSAAAKRAAAEAAAESVEIKFLGKKFTGPPTLPSTFALDLAALAAGDEGSLYRMISAVFGGQMDEVRTALAEVKTDDGGGELLGELVESIGEAYGVDEGE